MSDVSLPASAAPWGLRRKGSAGVRGGREKEGLRGVEQRRGGKGKELQIVQKDKREVKKRDKQRKGRRKRREIKRRESRKEKRGLCHFSSPSICDSRCFYS